LSVGEEKKEKKNSGKLKKKNNLKKIENYEEKRIKIKVKEKTLEKNYAKIKQIANWKAEIRTEEKYEIDIATLEDRNRRLKEKYKCIKNKNKKLKNSCDQYEKNILGQYEQCAMKLKEEYALILQEKERCFEQNISILENELNNERKKHITWWFSTKMFLREIFKGRKKTGKLEKWRVLLPSSKKEEQKFDMEHFEFRENLKEKFGFFDLTNTILGITQKEDSIKIKPSDIILQKKRLRSSVQNFKQPTSICIPSRKKRVENEINNISKIFIKKIDNNVQENFAAFSQYKSFKLLPLDRVCPK
ncbi:MAG TPA: hypothetical protein VEK38_00550, partial [Candidatus Bathyarchaeia archaeon]|nr:hypothetical protein [Candidatus Bathyarchaeia archaeon]